MGDGPPAVITSHSTSTDGSSPYSPMAMSALSNGLSDTPSSGATASSGAGRHPRSSSSGSLPSPALVTNEARQVLEAFLLRTQSMDRGSAGSMAALVPRHLEVIEEIRHTRSRRSGDSGGASVDGLVVETSMSKGGEIANMEVEHRKKEDGRHVTDITLHFVRDNERGERVLRTHVTHPNCPPDDTSSQQSSANGVSTAKIVTQESSEVFIDASLSRQCSLVDDSSLGATAAVSAPGLSGLTPTNPGEYRGLAPVSLPDFRSASGATSAAGTSPYSPPPSRAYDGDADRPTPSSALHEVAAEAAATGKAWKKRRKSFVRFARWLRIGGDGKSKDEQDERPPFRSMDSYSSTSSSTSSYGGAPTRSLVHRDFEAEERRRRKRRERRQNFRWRQQGGLVEAKSGSIFHQLYATLRYGRKRSGQGVHGTTSDPSLLEDDLVERRVAAFVRDGEASPSQTLESNIQTADTLHKSLPDIAREIETQDVLETFYCAIDKGSCKVHKNGNCPSVRAVACDDTDGKMQVDHAKLTLDLNSSSNSQSSNSQGNNTASSPEGGLGPDGVASKREIDSVARLLDELAQSIQRDLKNGVGTTHPRRKSVPNLRERASESEGVTIEGRGHSTSSASVSNQSLSRSSPMLVEEAEQAMRAKARRIRSQSTENLVSENLLSQLVDCDTYEHFRDLLLKSEIFNQSSPWRQITILYWLTRRIIRKVRRTSGGTERETTIKNFSMQFFNDRFAAFVVKRGGWSNLVESIEDSELD